MHANASRSPRTRAARPGYQAVMGKGERSSRSGEHSRCGKLDRRRPDRISSSPMAVPDEQRKGAALAQLRATLGGHATGSLAGLESEVATRVLVAGAGRVRGGD